MNLDYNYVGKIKQFNLNYKNCGDYRQAQGINKTAISPRGMTLCLTPDEACDSG